jgi:hypothetical protein
MPRDGDQASAAYAQSKPPTGDRSPTPPKEPGEAVAPGTTQREPKAPLDPWATGAGESNRKRQAP